MLHYSVLLASGSVIAMTLLIAAAVITERPDKFVDAALLFGCTMFVGLFGMIVSAVAGLL